MAVTEEREQFGNPEKGENPPLESVTRRQVKMEVLTCDSEFFTTYIRDLLLLLVATIYKKSIYPITIPNTGCNHSYI
jgi:hypothetical protein